MNPTDMTATQLVEAYTTQELSPVEATTAVLDRIDEIDGSFGAYCYVDRNTALEQAKASESRWHADQPQGLLDGVPVSIKDIFLTAGWPTLRGSGAVDPDQPWTVDSPVAARLRSDGMVFVGKTTTPELAWKAVTDSPLSGITRNPIDPRLTAGGSSGGAAAAVAAGMGPCAVGTDGGGSIRIPAAFCGIVGFKPTHGRIPMFPASPFGPLAHAGPMTRTVEDAALLMDILSSPDYRDPTSQAPPQATYRSAVNREVTGIHVAYSPDLGFASVDPEVAQIVEAAIKRIDNAGLNVATEDPGFPDPLEAFDILWSSGAATLLEKMPGARDTVDPGLGRLWDQGKRHTAVEYLQARDVAAQVGIAMGAFHERHDILLTPTVGIPAFEAGHDVPPGSGMDHWPQWATLSYPFNLTQQPAISIPVGTTAAGLPVGLQIVGPRHADDLVLAVAHFVEQLLA
ncbi:MAG: amidase [Yaniella sp.]|uniref:amidase n=1 Tax=Yaniella sp. TaxID=2773929 RepID=UPI002647C177|nr:amidase [Yaniella sp.]MDN5815182.1 amidase [Yaniella sp.]MDN5838691.1 amidase [Yaniella sp.]MDN5888963.1 amidase [Yaniella sp.]MDN6499234.1 amidase [Yaniella sp.]MDN6519728.1 amidase [Yaniella sp.]